jgi:LPS-assembly protein
MSPDRLTPSAARRAVLAAGVAVAAMLAYAPAHAQEASGTAPAPSAEAPSPDGLASDELYLEADRLTRDDKNGRTTAEGSVEIRYQGRTLRADRVVYDEGVEGKPGVIRAFGHVQLINSDGSIEFADQLALDDKMSAGVAQGFSARLPDQGKIASATAARRSETIQELNRAIYTPCEICKADGVTPKKPSWSIAADRVVQDKNQRIIFYRNARVRVKGVPVLYLPVFWHADPTAKRASGFLTPSFGLSDRRGLSYEQPYLWAVSPYTDIILSPQFNTEVNPFLNGQIRKRFYSGDVDLRFGYTYERDVDGDGNRFGDKTNRSYILGRGAFQLDDNWLLGFTAERTSDLLIFDKYDIPRVYVTRGPFVADDRRLTSQVYAIHQDRQNYFSAAALSIQGLRQTVPGEFENSGTFPIIAPLIEERYSPDSPVLGGRLRLSGSAVALTRDLSPSNLSQPGIDSRRITTQVDWRRTFTSSGGLRLDPFVSVRGDFYSLGDVPDADGVTFRSDMIGRGLATAGADISYPLYRRWGDSTVVLEPLVQAAISPNARQVIIGYDAEGNPTYLNEDSATFEFDETNLFRTNKFPGYDLYEDGARLNVAGRASVLWDDGRRASLLVGRSFRSDRNTIFREGSGLRAKASDWIVAADAQPIPGVSMYARARLDAQDLQVHRLEAGANASTKWASGFVRYLNNDTEVTGQPTASLSGGKQENMDVGGEVYFTRNWGASLYGSRDIAQGAWVVRDIGVFYRDDCVRVDVIYRKEDAVIYQRDNNQLRQIGRNEQIAVRLTLATLGGNL